MIDSLGRKTKNYLATFVLKGEYTNTRYTIAVEAISTKHASMRAWIKFAKTLSFKGDEDGWELAEVCNDSKQGGNPVVTPRISVVASGGNI